MTIPKYQIIVKDKVGIAIGEFSEFFNLKFSDSLNDYGQCTFDIPIDSKEVTALVSLRRYEVNIVRDGVVVWSGEQANADVTVIADSANLITITCYTYIEMLNARLTLLYVRFDNTDQAEILKALVDESQARTSGDFGFTFASITPTMDRDREYKLDNIMEAFINMSNVINGIDFWVDHDKVIHFAAERGSDKSAQFGLEYKVNFKQIRITDNFSSPANTTFAIGATEGAEPLIETYADASARSTYLLREQSISAIDVSESATLQGKAQDYVNKNKNQIRSIGIDQMPNTLPTIDTLFPGDSINVLFKKGRYDINTSYRIYKFEVSIGEIGEEYTSWTLGKIE